MHPKYWAILCVYLVGVEYAAATFVNPFSFFSGFYSIKGCSPKSSSQSKGKGSYQGCRCNSQLTELLDKRLESVRGRISHSYTLRDNAVDDYEITKGKVVGWRNFKRHESYGCSIGSNFAKIYAPIKFRDLTSHCFLSYLSEYRVPFYGGFMSNLMDIFGDVIDYSMRCMFDFEVLMTFDQTGFGSSSSGLVLESVDFKGLSNWNVQNDDLKGISYITDKFKCIFLWAVKSCFSHKMQNIFAEEIKNTRVHKKHFHYGRESRTTETRCKTCEEEYYEEDE